MYGADEKPVDVSTYFSALTSLLWLEYFYRGVADTSFDFARNVSWDVGCGTLIVAVLAFMLSLAFKEEAS
jgi:hypothetical protein